MSDTRMRVVVLVGDLLGLTTPEITSHPDDSSLADMFSLDELDQIDLVMALEDEFKVEIPDDKLEEPETWTVAGLTNLIETLSLARDRGPAPRCKLAVFNPEVEGSVLAEGTAKEMDTLMRCIAALVKDHTPAEEDKRPEFFIMREGE